MSYQTVPASHLTLRDALEVVFKHKWSIMGLYVVVVSVAAAYCFFWPPTYQAGVRFLVKHDRQEPIISTDQEGVRMLSRQVVTEDDLNSEMAIFKSASVLEKTARDANLESQPEHWAVRLLSAPLDYASRVYNEYHGKPNLSAFGKGVGRLARKLNVEAEKKSAILNVTVSWGDPRFAELLLDRLCQNYLAQHLSVHTAPDAQDFFRAQVERTEAELASLEKRIEAIHPGASAGMIGLEKDLYLKDASAFESEWRRARTLLAEAQARTAAVATELEGLPRRITTEEKTLSNPLALGQLKARVLELQLKRSQLLQKYKPEQLLVRQAEDELAQAQAMLARELDGASTEKTTNVNQIEQALRQDLALSRAKFSSLDALSTATAREFEEYKGRVTAISADGFRLQELERERRAAEQSFLAYAKKYEEAKADAILNRLKFVNVASIEPVRSGPDPVKPNRGLVMKLALSIGIILSVGYGFLLELLDQRVRTGRDLERFLDVP